MRIWNEIKSDEDIEYFMGLTGGLHDGVIVSMNYISGDDVLQSGGRRFAPYYEKTLSLVIYTDWCGYIEMKFSGVRKFSVTCFDDYYLHEISRCYLKFHTDLYGKRRDDRFIVWADSDFYPLAKLSASLNEKGVTYIIAETMKWRYNDN